MSANNPPLPREVDHLVVGAGFAGLGMAIKLQQAGESDFLVVEKSGGVGGTWRANNYPGAACDVPSQLYSFSFAPNPDWSRSFSPQPEIEAYINKVAQKSGVLDRFAFDTTLEDARWDDAAQRWIITTSRGEIVARTLISGSGGLSEPKMPDIEGIDTFQGEVFHSARWDHSIDLTGKRVAVIGTGASAIQIVPAIQPKVAHLDVYQRTAPWVVPRLDRPYSRPERFLLKNLPGYQRMYRAGVYLSREMLVPGFTVIPKLATPQRFLALANVRRGLKDPALRKKVKPGYAIGCKRILISNNYYPALDADNVDLVTDPIAKVTGNAVVTADGAEHPIDVLIVATGFHTTEQPIAQQIHGRDGRSLAEVWATSGMASYKGTTTRGFPNLFQIVGANTGLGHSSMVFIIESQIAYVVDAVKTMRTNRHATVEPRRVAQDDWNADLQERMQRTVWNVGGCSSWYLDEHGNNTTLWPRTTFAFRKLLARFDPEAYDIDAVRTTTPSSTTSKQGANA